MSTLLENILELKFDIKQYNNYCEVVIPFLNNMMLRLNDYYIVCIDIDINNKNIFIEKFNINLIGNKIKSIKSLEIMYNNILSSLNKHSVYIFNEDDYLSLFEKKKIPTKNNINRSDILEKSKNITRTNNIQIPKGLQLNYKQVFEMIYSEVEKVNKNMNYEHYIDFKDNDPYTLLFRLKYEKGELADKLKNMKSKLGIDYIEIIIYLDNTLYPFLAPSIEYSKPNIDNKVIYNLKNINILEQKNWNNNISLEWLLLELANKFEPYFNKYIDIDNIELTISKMDKVIFEIFKIMGTTECVDFNIKFDIPKFNIEEKSQYWSSGTGYGYSGKTDWNIQNYLTQQNNKKDDVISNLDKIIDWYSEYDNKEKVNKSMSKFITNQLRGITILDFNNNKKLYIKYLEIIEKLNLSIDKNIVSDIYQQSEDIINNEELSNGTNNIVIDEDEETNIFCIKIKKLFELNKDIMPVSTINETNKESYYSFVKNNQFGTYIFDDKHLYYKFKNDKISNKKNLLRLVSEISSLKKNLPISWDTSCILRVDKKQTNMIKFVIIGPKDTPYHNGIYEFHAYFPSTYPNNPPQLLLNTTDGGKVRFNPNLYATGKVCLSLLGTWSGQQGEKWNSDISTFLQVIISIQSLIMVEEPYFNEPGYERAMHTETGKKKAFDYKNQIRYDNLRVAILNQIKNPPQGFEEFTINHFKQKKEEILKVAEEWKNKKSLEKNIKIDNFIKELKELI